MEDFAESIGRFCSGLLLRLGISFGPGISRTYDRITSLTRRKHHDGAILRDICTVLDRTGRFAEITPKNCCMKKNVARYYVRSHYLLAGSSHWPAPAGFLFPATQVDVTAKEANIMDLCTGCASLHGRPADSSRTDAMKLVGIGECEGIVAIEHYRCEQCGTIMVRQLCGCASDQVWTALS